MNADRFRALALEQADAVEGSHHGHADFRIGGKIFASLPEDESFGVLNLSHEAQESFTEKYAGQFEPLKGGWGMRGWTRVEFSVIKTRPLREALAAARSKVASTKTTSTSAPSGTTSEKPKRRSRKSSTGPVAKRQTQRT